MPVATPPRFVFPLVWSTLYGCMGYASYLVYTEGGGFEDPRTRFALGLYGVKLLVNWSFTPVFFGMKRRFEVS